MTAWTVPPVRTITSPHRRGPGDFTGIHSETALDADILEPGVGLQLRAWGGAADRLLAAGPLVWLRGIDVGTQRRLRAELHIATLLDLAELEGPLPSAVATQLSDDTQRHLEHARAGLIPSRPLVAPLLAVDLDPVLDAELLHPIYARALRAMARPSAERRLAQSPLEHLHPIDAELAERLQTFHGLLTIGQLAAYRGVLDARVQRERPHTRVAALHRLRHALRPAPDPPSEVDVHAAIERGWILAESVPELEGEHANERFATASIEVLTGLSTADRRRLHAWGIHRIGQLARLDRHRLDTAGPRIAALQEGLCVRAPQSRP